MAQRTCDVDGCERKHQARGMCVSHWSAWYRQQFKEQGGRSHHPSHLRTCVTCGTEWYTPRSEAKFCTAKCKGVYLSERNRRLSKLDAGHPVMMLIEAAKQAERDQRKAARREAQRSKFAWRTPRECPACACAFTPLHTPNAVCCSPRCSRKMSKRRRRAREHNTLNQWRWSDFMRIARGFDYTCAYCGGREGQLEPDHVVPLSRGGDDAITNLLPSCHLCNADKNARTLDEWATWRASRGKPARATSWSPGDPRYVHLTSALASVA